MNIYTNFFTTYRLGPEDVISVSVFGQTLLAKCHHHSAKRQDFTRLDSRRPVHQWQDDRRSGTANQKKYDEYIIDPQVSVSLDKAASYRYSILVTSVNRSAADESPDDRDGSDC